MSDLSNIPLQEYYSINFLDNSQKFFAIEEYPITPNFNFYYNNIFGKEGLQPYSNDDYDYPENELEPVVKENFQNNEKSKNKSIMYIHKITSSEKKKKIDFKEDISNSVNVKAKKTNQSQNENIEIKLYNPTVVIENEKDKNVKNIFDILSIFEPKLERLIPEQKQLRDEILQLINKEKKKVDISSLNNNINKFLVTRGKIKNNLRKRKFKSDDILKKIKSRFLKSLKNSINIKLEIANSQYLFDFLPQCFICSITKKRNDISILNMTFKEMMSTDFYSKYNQEEEKEEDTRSKFLMKKRVKNKENKKENEKPDKKIELNPVKKKKKNIDKNQELHPDLKKFNKNLEVIKYLEDNEEISKKVNFEKIKNMKFRELFDEYLKSKEFEDDIMKLKKEDNESQEYINEYIIKASNFINYFSKSK